jgi:hypothetical protein
VRDRARLETNDDVGDDNNPFTSDLFARRRRATTSPRVSIELFASMTPVASASASPAPGSPLVGSSNSSTVTTPVHARTSLTSSATASAPHETSSATRSKLAASHEPHASHDDDDDDAVDEHALDNDDGGGGGDDDEAGAMIGGIAFLVDVRGACRVRVLMLIITTTGWICETRCSACVT